VQFRLHRVLRVVDPAARLVARVRRLDPQIPGIVRVAAQLQADEVTSGVADECRWCR
jgi:hypothetical protein